MIVLGREIDVVHGRNAGDALVERDELPYVASPSESIAAHATSCSKRQAPKQPISPLSIRAAEGTLIQFRRRELSGYGMAREAREWS